MNVAIAEMLPSLPSDGPLAQALLKNMFDIRPIEPEGMDLPVLEGREQVEMHGIVGTREPSPGLEHPFPYCLFYSCL